MQLKAGDILLLPGNPRHVMHDGSGAVPLPARNRASLNFTISENLGSDQRLDLLCGHFAIAPPHDRLLRSYLPPRLVVNAGTPAGQKETAAQLAGLVSLMRSESADDHLGGRAMLNALSTAMFALVLRLALRPSGAKCRSRPAGTSSQGLQLPPTRRRKTAGADPTDERRPARGGDAPSLAER